jgi:hypothetical protein
MENCSAISDALGSTKEGLETEREFGASTVYMHVRHHPLIASRSPPLSHSGPMLTPVDRDIIVNLKKAPLARKN